MFAAKNELFTRPSGGYQISRSLRFNSADSAYLNRTPATTTNQRTWTWSGWVKRSKFSTNQRIFQAREGTTGNQFFLRFSSDNTIYITGSSGAFELQTTQLFRDPSAWYHIVFACDTTQATSTNRFKLYINGSQVTAFGTATYPSQNLDTTVNSTWPHGLGAENSGPSEFYDGYMTEVNFIDGTQLTPSSFGETNADTGVWQPKAFSGTYGTNGFELNFSDNSNTTAATLGKDYSGNGNNWTPNNFSVTAGAGNDSLVDSPTSYGTDTGAGGTVRGNYATLNALATGVTLSNGNLDFTNGASNKSVYSTIGVSSGKWYCEVIYTTTGSSPNVGISLTTNADTSTYLGFGSAQYGFDGAYKYNNAAGVAYGSGLSNNQVIGIAFDADAGTITFYLSNVSQGVAFSSIPAGTYVFGVTSYNGPGNINFGQRAFAYTAPSGFKALCTQNLPTPTIGATTATQAGKFFNPVLYTGNSSTNTITGVGFQPDWTWIKRRDNTYSHVLQNAVTGVTKYLSSNLTTAEGTYSLYIQSWNSDGFVLGSGDNASNNSGSSYVAWNWKANGSGSSNTSGSITSTVSASTTSGFSIVTYTGTGANATVGHGLGVAPKMVITKVRDAAISWLVYNANFTTPVSDYFFLDTNAAVSTTSGYWNTAPTSTTFGIGPYGGNNGSGNTYVAYCFAPVAGYSAFGSYTGNGSADGPFVFTNFQARWLLIKRFDSTQNWFIWDTSRSPSNVMDDTLEPNLSDAENLNDSTLALDVVSNGFKIKTTGSGVNTSSGTYIYMAFASNPFKYSLAR